ncbi:MAG: ferrous iron transport protein A [Ruminococcus sp.]|nr:ferrous iron transport protein A [Ruminococcus sp.]
MRRPCKPLSLVMPGEEAAISSFHIGSALRERLYSLGMIPGTNISCLYRREGGLAAYSVRGTVIAIRLSDARYIMVKRK